jgi:hypothetical protein
MRESGLPCIVDGWTEQRRWHSLKESRRYWETWTRFSPSEGLALRLRHWGHEHCSERWLEGTRIENKNASTIAIKLGPIAVLAPHVWDEMVTLQGTLGDLAGVILSIVYVPLR